MTRLIAPHYLWHESQLCEGMAVEISGGRITRMRPLNDGETPDLRIHFLGPALTDLQVNGSGGVMLNSNPTAKAIAHIVETQRSLGTGWVMPTLITCEREVMSQAADAAVDAWGVEGFLGLHIEGPHLNVERKGTHNAACIRPIDDATLSLLALLRSSGIPVMLTLAPECVDADTIRRIADMGVVVSAGHSAATAAETRAGLAAGISCFTHLYNAMPPMQSREPGIVGAAINSDGFAGIIVDGHHVDWSMVALACRARPRNGRMFMISDAMATIGGPDRFELYGETIYVRDGALVNAAGSLAGAHIDLAACLANGVRQVGLPLAEAYEMAAMVPRDVMQLARPGLEAGVPVTEIIALDEQLQRQAL
ncbi:N-acetylglucosamine-6-phosphate deacetylase [Rhizobium sp. VS19-DR104.2]|uniref:N-acetylglucosamine-6-phosphate deacetylase n=1 Tax=unclassified Rhizobium TaxID=2613769 RepID=UPI001CC5E244|nr:MULTISPECIES: N-acetylglucosamine-6-phosphate deacetylase [unclassified Rhizobium]MBZ5763649.1 N-acetylglucosamine-6-phosphate deacetylase [Rhizobium sp. VS19-DR96]MBZ5769551.1 N-acetylglucosamine-6-phosphate deacetylase [Rhizobium sp. VS19-DR129.2]MBZ5777113.1 N-acetylglucosamine-6-phosphate deacetylase [Rhizobium sp. VS19-DRK62.2]MBZ5788254.1 N-acetylglucosamine-6-phosphate deacetylase [Rhizobium sp. VS19-DR121]MBZ5805677.1 N-acetylglucosamine-6-phosphate deacetylase [Rhizobium sp. VS19-D